MILVAYTRRSTERQVASPETQLHEITEFCAQQGHVLVRTYHEVAITAKSEIERRTAMPQLISDIKTRPRDFDGIIVWKLDRLMRNRFEHHRIMAILEKYKCEILSLKDPMTGQKTAADRLISAVMADFNAYEREVTGERIYAHHRSRLLQGHWPGGPVSMGFEWDLIAKVFTLSDRSDDVLKVFDVFISSNGNALATAKALNQSGIRSPRGGSWSNTVILAFLRNPQYRRQMSYDELRVDAAHIIPPLVPETVIAQTDVLLGQAKQLTPRHIGSQHVYSGLLYCSECGGRLTGGRYKCRGHVYVRWTCGAGKAKGICSSHQVSDRYIDALVGHAIGRLFAEYKGELKEAKVTKNAKPVKVKAARSHLEEKRRRIQDAYFNGYITREEFAARAEEVRVAEAADRPPSLQVALSPQEISRLIDLVGSTWHTLPGDMKRRLLLQIGCRITISTKAHEPALWIELGVSFTENIIRVQGFPKGRWGIDIS